jgi:hypothetical protein
MPFTEYVCSNSLKKLIVAPPDAPSPANARIKREEKLVRWRECLMPFIDPKPIRTHALSKND